MDYLKDNLQLSRVVDSYMGFSRKEIIYRAEEENQKMNDIFYPKQLLYTTTKRTENQCFFAMPFADNYTNLFDTLTLILESKGYKCVRVDKNNLGGVPIINLILNGIASSQYVIVDISDSNANVFYELGIAQTLKDADNIFMLKEANAKTYFDIQHLQYIQYDKNNLKKLADALIEKLESCQYKNHFWNAIYKLNILNEKQIDNFVNYFCTELFNEEQVSSYTYILDTKQEIFPVKQEYKKLLWEFEDVFKTEHSKADNDFIVMVLFKIFTKLLLKCCKDEEIAVFIEEFLNVEEYSSLRRDVLISYQTDLAIELASNQKILEISLKWIIDYFQRSKSTKVDLNRYKLEAFLLKNHVQPINEYIINAIFSENNYIREHMADIAGEKGLISAEENLIIQLQRECNYYTASSIIEALGKIHSNKAAGIIYEWIENNHEKIIRQQDYFVLRHARIALINIGIYQWIEKFENRYMDILEANYHL